MLYRTTEYKSIYLQFLQFMSASLQKWVFKWALNRDMSVFELCMWLCIWIAQRRSLMTNTQENIEKYRNKQREQIGKKDQTRRLRTQTGRKPKQSKQDSNWTQQNVLPSLSSFFLLLSLKGNYGASLFFYGPRSQQPSSVKQKS